MESDGALFWMGNATSEVVDVLLLQRLVWVHSDWLQWTLLSYDASGFMMPKLFSFPFCPANYSPNKHNDLLEQDQALPGSRCNNLETVNADFKGFLSSYSANPPSVTRRRRTARTEGALPLCSAKWVSPSRLTWSSPWLVRLGMKENHCSLLPFWGNLTPKRLFS